ncbi:hypothetical protein EMEDMD4_790103 [Sinorhizobium medicae]|uniref:Uncharacterized protein n=1 Tax=Sinorhizobium medicae TaxID=110321 RepID=A0A508X601_9HYPH|nr:hypothetical protein EMEDMD4_790103 [Sinorhizobium medicae]
MFERHRRKNGMAQQCEAAGAHRPCAFAEKLVVHDLSHRMPQGAVLLGRHRAGDDGREAGLRKKGAGVDSMAPKAFERVVHETWSDHPAFHERRSFLVNIAKEIKRSEPFGHCIPCFAATSS